MKYWNVLFIVSLYLSSSNAQEKNYKNEYAYKADVAIYNYELSDLTDRAKLCKEIIIEYKKEEREGEEWEEDWKIEKEALLESKDLVIVKNISFDDNKLPSQSCEYFLEESGGTLLGPFKSEYGAFRFVEITGGSIQRIDPSLRGETKLSNWILLRNDKIPIKKLQKIANEIIDLYEKGIGNKKCIDRKLKKYQIPKSVSTDCIVGKEAGLKQKKAPLGVSFYTLECPMGLAIIRLNKIAAKTRYVYYNEYIFK